MDKYKKVLIGGFILAVIIHLLVSFNMLDMDWAQPFYYVILYFGGVIGFTWFDYLGFHHFITKRYEREFIPKVIYRVIQTIVQWGLFLYLYFISPTVALAYIASWWFGVCDHMYYIFNDDERDWYFTETKKNMPWLWWTAYGMLNKTWRNNHTSAVISNYFEIVMIILIFFGSSYIDNSINSFIQGLF